METTPTPIHTPNRQATPQEREHALMVLRSLGSGLAIGLVHLSACLEPEEDSPILVTTAFDDIGDATILLVPPGEYPLAPDTLKQVTHLIGLGENPDSYPVLILEGEESEVTNLDTGDSSPMRVFQSDTCFANVALQASEQTVLETCFGIMDDKQFSDMFFNVEWHGEIDALNTAMFTFLHGRDWALEAYGRESYRARNGVEKGLDVVHQGMMNAIDNTFRPLVRLGEKLDNILGLK